MDDSRDPLPHDDPAADRSRRVVLRVDRGGGAWLAQAGTSAAPAPSAVRVLLRGRSRVELSAADADAAIAWARTAPGWDDARHPLVIYDPLTALGRC